MIIVCLECGRDMEEINPDIYRCSLCGFQAEQLKIRIEDGGRQVVRKATYEECMTLLESIGNTPPGDWTHELTEISSGPARFVERLILPSGLEVVYFRSPGGAKAWPASSWDRFAVLRQPERVEQLTLF